MKRKALVVWGGWDGHEPEKVAALFEKILLAEDFDVEVSNSYESFSDGEALKKLDLIVPVVTMSEIKNEYVINICEAVANGTGFAGCHGGMCDTFRENVLWKFMTGGTWVSHPGGVNVEYTVNIKNSSSSLVEGLQDFEVTSEQYYLHVDPAVEVLATTRFPVNRWYHAANGSVDMPVVWTKKWGVGRVYYNALGHTADMLAAGVPHELMLRGLLWAADGKRIALERGLDATIFASDVKNY